MFYIAAGRIKISHRIAVFVLNNLYSFSQKGYKGSLKPALKYANSLEYHLNSHKEEETHTGT